MKPTIIFREFEKLAEKMDIKIIQDKGDFKGGYCLLEKEGIIVVNKLKPLEQRIQALGQAFHRETGRVMLARRRLSVLSPGLKPGGLTDGRRHPDVPHKFPRLLTPNSFGRYRRQRVCGILS